MNFSTKVKAWILASLFLATGALAQTRGSTSTSSSSGSGSAGRTVGRDTSPLNPEQDFRTMAVRSQGISRTVTASTSDSAARLARADTYAKNAIQGISTVAKPEGMSDTNFTDLKNQTLAMANGSRGLVAAHKNEYEAAISELEQAVSVGPNQDPANYYLLGVANQNSGHFDKAVAAFEKCAAVKSNQQQTCVSGAEQAKKDAAQAKSK